MLISDLTIHEHRTVNNKILKNSSSSSLTLMETASFSKDLIAFDLGQEVSVEEIWFSWESKLLFVVRLLITIVHMPTRCIMLLNLKFYLDESLP